MIEVDLWAGEPLLPKELSEPAEDIDLNDLIGDSDDLDFDEILDDTLPVLGQFDYSLEIFGRDGKLFSKKEVKTQDFLGIYGIKYIEIEGLHKYEFNFNQNSAYALKYFLSGRKVKIESDTELLIERIANEVETPRAILTPDRKHIQINIPNLAFYRDLMKKVNGYPVNAGWRVGIGRVLDLEAMSAGADTAYPQIIFEKEVLQLNREPIVGFDGTLNSLKGIPIGSLNVISANAQTSKNLKTSKKTLDEKMSDYGLKSLHDLLFWLPRRYIDKTKPQDIRDLIEGESATILGKVKSASEMGNNMGVNFQIETGSGRSIRVTFFRQHWLKSKFSEGTEVLVTGKVGWYDRKIQLNGSLIEHAEEASVLPIVPIYKQSESKGITTNLLMSANRELLSRIKTIELPAYFKQAGRMDYCAALTELHFPTSLERHHEAVDTLAYYELVYMQLIMQEAKENSVERVGIEQKATSQKLQVKALKALPFELTRSQKLAVVELNKKLADPKPSSTLLSADVGSGKTIIAQLACIRAVEAGNQAVLLGPTDILGRQLFSTLEKLATTLSENGETIRIAYLGGSMKVREKKPILKAIKDGEIDIVVGTHAVLADSVEYKSLGFVAIDEQQKFGAEQRTKLLNSRTDGLVPDLLMQSATPIPRTTAQAYYGDMDLIELKEKPPGRIPIVTEWIEEDPVQITEQLINGIWSDIRTEAAAGNQTFIITPMVKESDKIDAASVQRTFKNLQEKCLPDLRIAFAHGQMKGDEQKIVMEEFRNKKYDVLVASTVVEVGVDIPDATRVVILSADRLGASSLHQIRGRVGRNSKPSKCYLVSLGKTENSQTRLQSLVDSEDGFEIAKVDLKIRGEGKMFSTEQSGRSEMIFASLLKHGSRIAEAQEESKRILKSPFRALALKDSRDKFESESRLF